MPTHTLPINAVTNCPVAARKVKGKKKKESKKKTTNPSWCAEYNPNAGQEKIPAYEVAATAVFAGGFVAGRLDVLDCVVAAFLDASADVSGTVGDVKVGLSADWNKPLPPWAVESPVENRPPPRAPPRTFDSISFIRT